MTAGATAAQAVHAAVAYACAYPDVDRTHPTVVVLTSPADALIWLLDASTDGVAFFEPDLGMDITAVALTGPRRAVSTLPLLGASTERIPL